MNIHTTYVQKSSLFLWPILEIKSKSVKKPINTYSLWLPDYKAEDCKFIMLYNSSKIPQDNLEKSEYLCDVVVTKEQNVAYIFDFSQKEDFYSRYINGEYSTFSDDDKNTILNTYKYNKPHYEIMHSYLYPEEYYESYADFYKVSVSDLQSVRELCSKPDLVLENLTEIPEGIQLNS